MSLQALAHKVLVDKMDFEDAYRTLWQRQVDEAKRRVQLNVGKPCNTAHISERSKRSAQNGYNGRPKDHKKINQVQEMLDSGMTITQIAEDLDVTRSAIRNVINRNNLRYKEPSTVPRHVRTINNHLLRGMTCTQIARLQRKSRQEISEIKQRYDLPQDLGDE